MNREYKNNFMFHLGDKSFEWNRFYMAINRYIVEKLGLTEDKQLGQFFIKFHYTSYAENFDLIKNNNFMKEYKNKKIEDILISGYIEKGNKYYFFQPLLYWIFLMLDNGQIIELYSGYGNIKLNKIKEIKCNFDIEDEDIFCLTSFSKEDYGTIEDIKTYSDTKGNICKIEIKTDIKDIILDASSSFNGFKINII